MTRILGLRSKWFPLVVILFAVVAFEARANTIHQFIVNKRAALSISPVRLYTDSMYTRSTETTFAEGELFEVISESKLEHPDNTQNQTFKWFQVKTVSGKTGWVFGDNLAVVTPERFVEAALRPFYKKKFNFDNGFENALVWVAALEGHDDKYKGKGFMNPPYKELYLILTNDRGKSVSIQFGNLNESGRREIQTFDFQDITTDAVPEIIIQTLTKDNNRTVPERQLEIFSFKAGTLAKIFEERLSLTWENDVPSPIISKFIEIEGTTIRLAYLDFIDCTRFSLGLKTDVRTRTQERCLEYVTLTYQWDVSNRHFKPLYAETRTAVQAYVVSDQILRSEPQNYASVLRYVAPSERLSIVKHYEVLVVENGKKKIENWLYAKQPSGDYGYLRAADVRFKNLEQAEVLHTYYAQPPLLKADWQPVFQFLALKN
jgi:hypothetical protein